MGADEAYITVNDSRLWGPRSMNNGNTCFVNTEVPLVEGESLRIRVCDEDDGIFDPDDVLGEYNVVAQPGEGVATFRGTKPSTPFFIASSAKVSRQRSTS